MGERNCYCIGRLDSCWGPSREQDPLSWPGGSFSDQIPVADTETDTETEAALALFSSQRMEKQEPHSQINFSPHFRWRHQIWEGRGKREGIEKRVGGIFVSYLRTGVWFGSGKQLSFSALVRAFQLLSWQLSTVVALTDMSFSMLMY